MQKLQPQVIESLLPTAVALKDLFFDALSETISGKVAPLSEEEEAGLVTIEDLKKFFGNESQIIIEIFTVVAGIEGVQLVVFPLMEGTKLFGIDETLALGTIDADHPLLAAVGSVCDAVNARARKAQVPIMLAAQSGTVIESPDNINDDVLQSAAVAYRYILFGDKFDPIAFAHLVGEDFLNEVSAYLPSVAVEEVVPLVAEPPLPSVTRLIHSTPVPDTSMPPVANVPSMRASKAEMSEIPDETSVTGGTEASLLDDVHLSIRVLLGASMMTFRDVKAIGKGKVIKLDSTVGDPLEIYIEGANNRLTYLGKGETMVLEDERFGVRIIEIVAPHKRLGALRPDAKE